MWFNAFLEKIIDYDFVGLNVTNHLFAHWCIFVRTEFSGSAA